MRQDQLRDRLRGAVLLALLLGGASPALASPEAHWRHHAQQIAQSVDLSALPHVYALRPLEPWLDAGLVLADLTWLSQDQGLHPLVRAHLQQRLALHRMHRGDAASADALVHDIGLITRWSVAASSPGDDAPPAGGWQALEGMDFAGYQSLQPWWAPERPAQTLWLRTTLRAEARQEAALWVGAEGRYQLWLNGQPVGSGEGAQAALDQHRWPAWLRAGDNELWVALRGAPGGGEAPGLYLRLTDARHRPLALPAGSPLPGRAPGQEAPSPRSPGRARALTAAPPLAQAAGWSPAQVEEALLVAALLRALEPDAADAPWAPLAEAALTRAAALREAQAPINPWALLLARGLQPDDQPDHAVARLAAAQAPEDPWIQWSLAATLLDGQGAARVLEALALLEPLERAGSWPAAALHARLDAAVGLPEAALARLEPHASAAPAAPALWEALAELLQRAERPQDELQARLHLLTLRAADARQRARAAELLLLQGRGDEALALLDEGARLAPEARGLASLRARALRDLGRLDEAAAQWEALLAQRPDDRAAHEALAELDARRGHPARARDHLQAALTASPGALRLQERLSQEVTDALGPEAALLLPPEDPRLRPPLDPDPEGAPLLVLASQVFLRLHPDGGRVTLHQRALAPLTAEGARRAATHTISYNPTTERVELLQVRVQSPGGPPRAAWSRQDARAEGAEGGLLRERAVATIQLQGVQPGDVVELRWRVHRAPQAHAPPFSELRYLQEPWPVRFARVAAWAPPALPLHARWGAREVKGALLTQRRALPGQPWVLEAYHLPAIAPEPQMPGLAELSAHLLLTALPDWGELARWYDDLTAPALASADDPALRALALQLTEGLTDPAARAAALHRFVATQIRYLGLELGAHSWLPYDPALTLQRGFGDCKDQSTLLVALLRAAGIEARLVLVRTRGQGELQALGPGLLAFDHVIAYAPALGLYLDPTEARLAAGALPARLSGAQALVVEAGASLGRLPAAASADHRQEERVEVDLRGPDAPRWRGSQALRGRLAAPWREALARDPDPRAWAGPPLPGLRVTEAQVEGAGELAEVIQVRWEGEGGAPIQRAEGRRWLYPTAQPRAFLSRWAQAEARRQPLLTQGPLQEAVTVTFQLPAGLRALPRAAQRSSGPFGAWSVEVEALEGGALRVKARWSLEVARVSATEYAAWRGFVTELERAVNAPIWLEEAR
jgi:transglutaminase-like putative cysteine protease/tetratricopeptide (TPR) repeat protein